MPDILINEDNFRDHEQTPFGRGLLPRTSKALSRPFLAAPDFPLIPRIEWASRAADLKSAGANLRSVSKRAGRKRKNQAQTNYCHANSPCVAVETIRAVQGHPYVELSPGSVGGPVTNYRNEGAVIDDDLEVMCRLGAASTAFVPANQISRAGWKPGAEANALLHRVTQWYDMMYKSDGKMFDRVATLILSGFPVCVGLNWWSHAVTAMDLIHLGGKDFAIDYENSWGAEYGDDGYVQIAEGKGTPDSAYAPLSLVASEV